MGEKIVLIKYSGNCIIGNKILCHTLWVSEGYKPKWKDGLSTLAFPHQWKDFLGAHTGNDIFLQ